MSKENNDGLLNAKQIKIRDELIKKMLDVIKDISLEHKEEIGNMFFELQISTFVLFSSIFLGGLMITSVENPEKYKIFIKKNI